MAGVTLEHLTKSFPNRRGDVRAVDDLSLTVADGELLVLVGPSGCGKTTTLRLIAGLEEMTAGTVRIGDRVVNGVPPKDRDVAMVFQNYALYPHMTVFANMAFGLKMRRVPKAEIRARVGEVARLLHVEALLDRRPAALSGGERQRVALGRAIVRRPKVFLFDEPLCNLDARLRVRMRAEIKALHRTLQATIIHVTHDQEEAMTLGDRIAVLKDGRIQQCGAPLEAYNRPVNRFVAGFIGTPPMNFLRGRLERDGGAIRFVSSVGRLPVPGDRAEAIRGFVGGPVVLGLRPEHVHLGSSGPAAVTRGWSDARRRFAETDALSVGIVEPLGDSIHVHVGVPESDDMVARIPPETVVRAQDRVRLDVDMTRAHFFSAAETGERLD